MSKAKILLVEDNKIQAAVIREFLEKNGYGVIWAENGMSAFRAAKTERLDLVLLDVVLPDIDGNEVCRWLKLNEDTRVIPVIMLTDKKTTPDKVAGLEAGANDYLPKPFDEGELNARIYAQLRLKQQHDELKLKNQRLEEMLAQMETLATVDSLTGLCNRRHLESVLEKEFKLSTRYGFPLSCIMIDIDHFKAVNDLHGHMEGDLVLQEMARLILTTIREIDIAARWGGDEFILLIPNTPKESARQTASRIRKAVSGHRFTGLGEQVITISIGIAGLPDPSIDSQKKLVHAADLAMYETSKKTEI